MVTKTKTVPVIEQRNISWLDPEAIEDNPFQPRQHYQRAKIEEIGISIKEHGLRQTPEGRQVNGNIQIAFGHYRKRSFLWLKKKYPKQNWLMPVEVKELSDEQMFMIALEENLRRGDITPMETARTIDKYLTVFPKATEVEIAAKLQMTQPNVSNMRRVLKLPKDILDKIDEGKINFTMGRELLMLSHLPNALDLMRNVLKALNGRGWPSYPCTVDGIVKAIDHEIGSHLPSIEKDRELRQYYYTREPLFDPEAGGCWNCEKTLTTKPTKTKKARWCLDPDCWKLKQENHRKDAARVVANQMAADVAKRVEDDVVSKNLQQSIDTSTTISQEISDSEIDELVTQAESEKEDKFRPHGPLCADCLNAVKCYGQRYYTAEDGTDACDGRLTKDDFRKGPGDAVLDIPQEILDKIKDKAGTRAEILDLERISYGGYGNQLNFGYERIQHQLDRVDDPEECTERCTWGFHYAFDSRHPQDVSWVCNNRKCFGKKKGAKTRATNAAGTEKKKAETKAIQEAIDQTTTLDRPRLKVLFAALTNLDRWIGMSYYYSGPQDWILKELGIEPPEMHKEWNGKATVLKAFDKLSDEDAAKMLIQISLEHQRYNGDVGDWKVQTTEYLNWMGIGVTTEKKEAKKKKEGKNSNA